MWSKRAWQTLAPWLSNHSPRLLLLAFGFSLMLLTLWAGVGLLGLSAWFISAAALSVVAFDIFLPGAAIRALALLRTVARYFERVKNHDVVLRWQHLWRVRLFSQLLRAPTLASERFRSAQLLQRLTQDLAALDDLYLRILGPLLSAALTVLLLGGLFWLLSPVLAAVMVLPSALLLWALSAVFAERMAKQTAAELSASEGLREQALDYVRARSELKAWGVQGAGLAPLNASQVTLERAQRQVRERMIRVQAALELFHYALLFAVLVVALWLSFEQVFSHPLALLLGFAVLATADIWQPLAQATLLWGRTVGAAKRIADIEPRDQQDVPQAPLNNRSSAAQGNAPKITIRQMPATRASDELQTVSLTVEAGQKLLLFGRSGCGKSTLLYRIAGMLPSEQGTLGFNGSYDKSALPSCCLLTQHNDIFAASVADNLDLARTGMDDARLWHALELVELADDIARYPDQLDTWLGDGGQQLSGGQARRLALARCILHPAPTILLDEPFAGVGSEQARRIWQNIQPWLAHSTVICVMHQKLPDVSPSPLPALVPELVSELVIVQQDFELCYDRRPEN